MVTMPGSMRRALASPLMSDRIATHQQPPDANFLLHADLAEHGMPDAREQLWARQLDERRFAMRSLPFFTYGIALHDEVETDGTFTITRVVRSSGHRLLRVAVDRESAESFHGEFHPMLEAAELLHEWNGLGYVAVDLPPGGDAAELLAWLEARAAEGAVQLEEA
jgi:hypothetical protein